MVGEGMGPPAIGVVASFHVAQDNALMGMMSDCSRRRPTGSGSNRYEPCPHPEQPNMQSPLYPFFAAWTTPNPACLSQNAEYRKLWLLSRRICPLHTRYRSDRERYHSRNTGGNGTPRPSGPGSDARHR